MKNLIKLLPIVAVFIGTSVAFATTTSLKEDTVRLYYYEGEWHEDEPTSGACIEKPSQPEEICSADFDVMNLPSNGDPKAVGTTPLNVEYGEIL